MKVSVPCAAALARFPFDTAFPASTAAPGELDIIKYGLAVRKACGLNARQSSGVSISLPDPPRSLKFGVLQAQLSIVNFPP
jgi:hypothetical protein